MATCRVNPAIRKCLKLQGEARRECTYPYVKEYVDCLVKRLLSRTVGPRSGLGRLSGHSHRHVMAVLNASFREQMTAERERAARRSAGR